MTGFIFMLGFILGACIWKAMSGGVKLSSFPDELVSKFRPKGPPTLKVVNGDRP